MKQLFFFISLNCILLTSINAQQTSLYKKEDDMSWYIANLIERYYYSYFDYPQTLENLVDFTWDIIKDNLTYYVLEPYDKIPATNSQYQDFITSSHSFIDALKYLKANQDNLTIRIEDNSFILQCKTDSLFVNYTADICRDLKNRNSKLLRHKERIFFYDKNNKMVLNSRYSKELADKIKVLRNKYGYDKQEKKYSRHVFIQYNKGENQLTPLCSWPNNLFLVPFISQLPLLLDDFLKDKNINSIILLFTLPSDKACGK